MFFVSGRRCPALLNAIKFLLSSLRSCTMALYISFSAPTVSLWHSISVSPHLRCHLPKGRHYLVRRQLLFFVLTQLFTISQPNITFNKEKVFSECNLILSLAVPSVSFDSAKPFSWERQCVLIGVLRAQSVKNTVFCIILLIIFKIFPLSSVTSTRDWRRLLRYFCSVFWKLGRWHWGRKGSWGCLRTWRWGEYLDRGGTR